MKSANPQEQTITLPDGRVVTIRARSAEAYSPNPSNSNRGKPRGVAALDESIQLSGLHRGIVVAADGTVVNGNHAYESAVANGVAMAWIEVDVEGDVGVVSRRTDWESARVPAAIVAAHADNRSAQLNYELAPEQFAVDLQVLAELGQSLPATLFTEEEINFALGQDDSSEIGETEEDEQAVSDLLDDADEGKIASRVKLGEIWQLGRHRICCGDSTDEGNVRALLGDRLADACWTDPPYGLSYAGKTADALTIENDGSKDLPVFISNAFFAISIALKPGSPVYVAHPAGALHGVFFDAFADRFYLRQELVWVKNTFALGYSDYHYRHEPILFGYTKGGKGRLGRGSDNWFGDNCQDSVFEVDKPSRNAEHPTMKPIELIEKMLSNSTSPIAILFEPFLGSGSTLIAAQQMNGDRTVYGFELSPDYCEVVLQRFTKLTGVVPELVGHLQETATISK